MGPMHGTRLMVLRVGKAGEGHEDDGEKGFHKDLR
jgi:hypothetical protein